MYRQTYGRPGGKIDRKLVYLWYREVYSFTSPTNDALVAATQLVVRSLGENRGRERYSHPVVFTGIGSRTFNR